jgi:hypothetical protein
VFVNISLCAVPLDDWPVSIAVNYEYVPFFVREAVGEPKASCMRASMCRRASRLCATSFIVHVWTETDG